MTMTPEQIEKIEQMIYEQNKRAHKYDVIYGTTTDAAKKRQAIERSYMADVKAGVIQDVLAVLGYGVFFPVITDGVEVPKIVKVEEDE